MYDTGQPIDNSIKLFEKMAEKVFKRREVLQIALQLPLLGRVVLGIPILRRLVDLAVSYISDGIYSPENIEAALKEAFGTEKSILDCSYAASIGTKLGMLVATVSRHPSCRIFANYNRARAPDESQGKFVEHC